MTGLFFALLGLYVVYALFVHRLGNPDRPNPVARFATIALHTPLFLVACYLAYQRGVFSRELVSPLYICAGLFAGHLIFGLSLFATHRNLPDTLYHMCKPGPVWEFLVENPRIIMRFAGVSVAEEIVYRAAAQPLLIDATGSAAAGIAGVAVAFAVVHKHFFRNAPGQSAEFAAFAIALGVLYYLTGSLILVIVIHAVRNIEIAYLESCVEDDEAVKDKMTPQVAIRNIEATRGL